MTKELKPDTAETAKFAFNFEQSAGQEKEQAPRQSDWPLEDILELSGEAKTDAGAVETYTAHPDVEDHKIIATFAKAGNHLSFRTKNPENFEQTLKQNNPYDTEFTTTEEGRSLDLDDIEIQIAINPIPDSEENEVRIDFSTFATSWVGESLTTLGMKELLQNHTIPETLSPEYMNSLLQNGEITVGEKTIPVELALNQEEISNHVPEIDASNKRQVFHGGSMTDALSIARSGLFSERPGYTRPILSAEPDVMSAKLAQDEWSGYPRTDPSKYGAIIVFEVTPEEIESHGVTKDSQGRPEELFQPAISIEDEDERYRLQRNKKTALPGTNAGYIPPEKITKIIAINQTTRTTSESAS